MGAQLIPTFQNGSFQDTVSRDFLSHILFEYVSAQFQIQEKIVQIFTNLQRYSFAFCRINYTCKLWQEFRTEQIKTNRKIY